MCFGGYRIIWTGARRFVEMNLRAVINERYHLRSLSLGIIQYPQMFRPPGLLSREEVLVAIEQNVKEFGGNLGKNLSENWQFVENSLTDAGLGCFLGIKLAPERDSLARSKNENAASASELHKRIVYADDPRN